MTEIVFHSFAKGSLAQSSGSVIIFVFVIRKDIKAHDTRAPAIMLGHLVPVTGILSVDCVVEVMRELNPRGALGHNWILCLKFMLSLEWMLGLD